MARRSATTTPAFWSLMQRVQRGVNSIRFVPGPNNATREAFLEATLDGYLRMRETA